ncbi:hypothetical protein LJC74_05035 [Eubacteriales bacterium OttesenSCG-928-A19]|nr:hypothetical protein [Eubacteriales bacterium OttesenSCG-928-A19]
MDVPLTFSVQIGGHTLELPVVPLSNAPVSIALFDSLGDLALCDFLAERMIAVTRDRGIELEHIDVILTAGKAVTLAESTARRLGMLEIAVAERQAKSFWPESFGAVSRSITGGKQERLVVGGRRAKLLAGKRILIIDDVISTGESIRALTRIARHYGEPSLIMAPFFEGDHSGVKLIEGIPAVVLKSLPVWPR